MGALVAWARTRVPPDGAHLDSPRTQPNAGRREAGECRDGPRRREWTVTPPRSPGRESCAPRLTPAPVSAAPSRAPVALALTAPPARDPAGQAPSAWLTVRSAAEGKFTAAVSRRGPRRGEVTGPRRRRRSGR